MISWRNEDLWMLFFYCVIILGSCECRDIGPLKFSFKGLIGLPKALKLHILVGFEDLTTNEEFVIDFLPLNAANPDVMASLISGKSMPGEVRVTKSRLLPKDSGMRIDNSISNSDITMGRGDIQSIGNGELFAERIVTGFKPELNLYFNNCYHFAFYCFLRDNEVRSSFEWRDPS
jgi:hypothetical protein